MGMATEKGLTSNPLEQFVLMAQSVNGDAAVDLINQILEAPGVYVFGELLDVTNISELEKSAHAGYFQLLNLFAYGTYRQYLNNKSQLPDLTPIQKKKLQHLTIVTLSARSKFIPYPVLLQELDIKNVRDLEDLIIEAVYNGVIHGKLDQRNRHLEVDYAIGRDVQTGDLGSIISILQEWCDSCENVLSCVETQISHANAEKLRSVHHKESVEKEIMKVKASLKTPSQDGD